MEFLKDIYGEEALTYEQFCEKVKSTEGITIGNIASGEYVTKKDYDELSQQLNLEKTNSVKKLNEYKFGVELSRAFVAAGVADEVSAKANLNMEKIKLDEDGKITGLTEQLTDLKETKPYLFKTEKPPKLNLGGSTPGADQSNLNGLKGAIEEYYKD